MRGLVYTNRYFNVYDYGNGELHIEPIESGPMFRLTSEPEGTVITTAGSFGLRAVRSSPAIVVES